RLRKIHAVSGGRTGRGRRYRFLEAWGLRAGFLSASRRKPSSRAWIACAQRAITYRPHALLHLARHIIVTHDGAAVAQAARLSLHDEHPERVAGLHDQGTPCLLR